MAAITAGAEAAPCGLPVAGTGRLLRIGPATGPAIAVRAELDALPVAERTGAAWSSEVSGAMHACGHDVHLAALVALARAAATATGRSACRSRCWCCCSRARSGPPPGRGTWWRPGCWPSNRSGR